MEIIEFYFIVYPGGDKTQLAVASLNDSTRYEKGDYDVASRKEFNDEEECSKYARELADKNNLVYKGDTNGYLD